jgi:hypothetical protein
MTPQLYLLPMFYLELYLLSPYALIRDVYVSASYKYILLFLIPQSIAIYPRTFSNHVDSIKPLTPELNPSAQRCLTKYFTWDFAS